MVKPNEIVKIPTTKQITPQAINDISLILRPYNFVYPPQIGYSWIEKSDGCSGTIPRRIDQFFYKNFSKKIKKEDLETIGQIAKRSLPDGNVYAYIDFTKKFDWARGDFKDERSCFWGSKALARTMLEKDPTFVAIRSWNRLGTQGLARCLSVIREGGLVLFNAYGATPLSGFAVLMSEWMKIPAYTQVFIHNQGCWDGVLHLNNGMGIFIGKNPPKRIDFNLPIPDDDEVGVCTYCRGPAGDNPRIGNHGMSRRLCKSCATDVFSLCDRCQDLSTGQKWVYRFDDHGVRKFREAWCARCIRGTVICGCGLYLQAEGGSGSVPCPRCASEWQLRDLAYRWKTFLARPPCGCRHCRGEIEPPVVRVDDATTRWYNLYQGQQLQQAAVLTFPQAFPGLNQNNQ